MIYSKIGDNRKCSTNKEHIYEFPQSLVLLCAIFNEASIKLYEHFFH